VSRSKIDDLLTERHRRFTPLQRLLHRAANQTTWTEQLRALLPEPLRDDCRVSDVRGGIVIIACRTAASATRLRFMSDELLGELRQLADFSQAREIRVRVTAA
jgi:hypothetical protein